MTRRRGLARGISTILLLLCVTAPAGAQRSDSSPANSGSSAELVETVERLREAEPWLAIPAPDGATTGARAIAPGERVAGDVVVVGGTLEVHGTIDGDAAAYGGDVVIHPGGLVRGDAVAVLGRVRIEGGTVGGEFRSVRGSLEPAPLIAGSPSATVGDRLGLVTGWLVVLLVMGVGVTFFASGPLAGVTETLQRGFGRALLVGVAGQIALLPALLVVIVALAATLIGILLIPFAVVAFALAAAGLMMLGFLAVARVTGGALIRGASPAGRGAELRALVVGILLFVALWVLAALLTPMPLANAVMRAVAFALSWVAMTAGFGAAILSRAGTRRDTSRAATSAPPLEEDLSWQTPTPIGGVTAARRPVSTSSH